MFWQSNGGELVFVRVSTVSECQRQRRCHSGTVKQNDLKTDSRTVRQQTIPVTSFDRFSLCFLNHSSPYFKCICSDTFGGTNRQEIGKRNIRRKQKQIGDASRSQWAIITVRSLITFVNEVLGSNDFELKQTEANDWGGSV